MNLKAQHLSSLYPFESHYVTVDGYKMHYVDECSVDECSVDDSTNEANNKEVVILLHGNPTWSFYYRNLITHLSKSYRVIAPDYIGCGLSDHPQDKHFRAVDRVRQVQHLIDTLGIDKFSLVMHDWGGPIGTRVALNNLDRVQKLIYLNTTLTEVDSLPKIIKTAAMPLIGKWVTQYTSRFVQLLYKFGTCKKLSKEIKDGYMYPYREASQRIAIWDFVADIPFDVSHPTHKELLSITEQLPLLKDIPVKIIWGLKDPCFHREMLSKVAGHFPHAEVLELSDASHLVLEDVPEYANEEIEMFLKHGKRDQNPDLSQHSLNPLYQAFDAFAEKFADNNAVITANYALSGDIRYSYTNYKELSSLVRRFERGLHSLGVKPNDRVLFLFPVGVDFLALALATMGRGAVPVFVDPGVGKEKLKQCITDANPDVVIWVPQAHILKRLWKDVFKHVRLFIIANDWLFWKKHTISFLKKYSANPLPPVTESKLCFIAFTSGATGTPKGVVYTNEMMSNQLKILSNTFKIKEGGIDLPLLPIFALFNLGLGVTSVFAPNNPKKPLALDPAKILKIISDLKITSSFGSPTIWTKISEFARRTGNKLHTIKQIFIAGAPVWKETLDSVQSILPNGEVYTPYGATEALPVTFLSAHERTSREPEKSAVTGEVGVDVGHTIEEAKVAIIKAVDGQIENANQMQFLKPFEIGEVVVKGSHVSPTYLNRIEANKVAKIPAEDGFWHRMGDMGYLDNEGNLYFCGRKAHLVVTKERVYYSIPTERIFKSHPKAKRVALIDVKGKGASIAVEPFPQFFPQTETEKMQFIDELRNVAESNELTKHIKNFYFHPSFPVDARHNAKIYRDQIGEWASKQ